MEDSAPPPPEPTPPFDPAAPTVRIGDESAATQVPPGTGAASPAEPAPRHAPDPGLAGGHTFADRYLLHERLGVGGMGEVYRATDLKLARPVALKRILGNAADDPDARARFRREATAAARLKHPAIVAVHDVGEWAGKPYLAMEFVTGRTLAARLDETRTARSQAAPGRFDRLKQDIGILAEIADAVAFAHAAGILHRDIKPANVLIDPSGRPHLTDFGLAKAMPADGAESARLTATGQLLGTPQYMSPEQAGGDPNQVGPASDLWALGIVLYEILTGAPPVLGRHAMEVIHALLTQDVPAPSTRVAGVPAPLDWICLKTLAREPARRYAGVREFADELRRWLADEPVRTRLPTRAEQAARWLSRRRRSLVLAGAVVVAITGVVLGSWLIRMRAEQRSQAMLIEIGMAVTRFEDAALRTNLAKEARAALAAQPLELIEQAARARPDSGPLCSLRGRVFDLLGETAEAEQNYDLGCARSPLNAGVWYLRGLHRAEQYVARRALPAANYGGSGTRFEAATIESAEETALRMAALTDWQRAEAAPEQESWLGEADLRLGRGLAALATGTPEGLATAALRLGDTPGPRFARARAQVLYQLGQFEAAAAAAESAVTIWTGDPLSWSVLGRASLMAAEARRRDNRDARATFARAIAAFDQALECHADALLAHANRGAAWYLHGRDQARRHEDPQPSFRSAMTDFDFVLQRSPSDAVTWNHRGNVWRNLGVHHEQTGADGAPAFRNAIADYSQALDVGGDRTRTLENRAIACWSLGDAERHQPDGGQAWFERARDDLDVACQEAPDRPSLLKHRAIVRLDLAEGRLNRHEDPEPLLRAALADAEAALRLDPEIAGGHAARGKTRLALAQALQMRNEPVAPMLLDAVQDLEAAAHREPKEIGILNSLGTAWHGLAREREARGGDAAQALATGETVISAALTFEPDHAALLSNRAELRAARAREAARRGEDPGPGYEQSIADRQRAAELHADTATFWYNLGGTQRDYGEVLLARGGDALPVLEAAIASYTRALAIRPAWTLALNNCGAARLHAATAAAATTVPGRDPLALLDAAARDFDAALAADPAHRPAYSNRALSRFRAGALREQRGIDARADFEVAAADFARAATFRPDDGLMRESAGAAESRLADAQQAAGQDPRPAWGRALAHLEVSDRLRTGQGPAAAYRGLILGRWAALEAEQGRDPGDLPVRAAAACEEAVRRDPRAYGSWEMLGHQCLALGQRMEATGQDGRANLRRAAEAYSQVFPGSTDLASARFNRALALQTLATAERSHQGAPEEVATAVLTELAEVLRLRPELAHAVNLRGNARHLVGDVRAERGEDATAEWRSAEADFRAAIQLGFPIARFNLGLVLRSMGRWDEAIATFEAAARDLPENSAWATARIEETRRMAEAQRTQK